MLYVICCSIIVTCLVLYTGYTTRATRRRNLEKIRAAWGNPKDESFHFDRIEKYSALAEDREFHHLTKQTIDDADLYEVFSVIDRTTSKVGQQYLFKKLIRPVNDMKALHQLDTDADLFAGHVPLREEVQKELEKLSSNDAYYIVSLLQNKLLDRPEWFRLLIISITAIVILSVLSVIYPVLLIFLIIPVTVNTFVHYWNKNKAFQFANSFPQLNVLIQVSDNISKKDIRFSHKPAEKSVSALKPFQWKLGLLSLTSEGGIKDELSQVAGYFIELLKASLLIEVFTFFHLIKELEEKKESISILFNYIGGIDAAISVASLRAGTLKTCRPDLTAVKKELLVKNIYHPLVQDCVKNDLAVRSKSVLITGSNMSGKTTFLRTLIVNSILAQTIYTCFADVFKTPALKQFSSIRIDDDLFEGKSYYFEEVNIMAYLIHEARSRDQNIFVLDEVFKGTNTIERIASAKAILSYLNHHNNIVIVSTHDIELAGLLASEYDLYHFAETIENGRLHFDHTIKAGPLKTTNAIKILEMSNYPEEIVNEARQLSLTLRT
jgi:DNA mismatch repair ATPase MutS